MKWSIFVLAAGMVTSAATVALPPPGYPWPPPPGSCPDLCVYQAPQRLVIPAFFPLSKHSDLSKSTDWVRIQNAGGTAVYAVVALGDVGGFQSLDLASDCAPAGQGGGLCDAKAQFMKNWQAGEYVFGYANTQSATKSYATNGGANGGPGPLLQELTDWQRRYMNTNAPPSGTTPSAPFIQGMFLDVGPTFDPSSNTASKTETDYRDYYLPLYSLLHNTFGVMVMQNASQYPGQSLSASTDTPDGWILGDGGADAAVVFEQTATALDSSYVATGADGRSIAPPAWWQSSSGTFRTAHVISAVTQFTMQHVTDTSGNDGATLHYAFDGFPDASGTTRYDHVSCFFEQQVSYVQNRQPTNGAGSTWCQSDAVPACHDLKNDATHCGSCENSCAAGFTCQNGQCVDPPPPPPPPSCPAGTIDCNGDASLCVKKPAVCP
jgi:hypothetical protein